MDGVHDMGGMHGFGDVPTADDAQFHADWERVVFAMDKLSRAQGITDIDEKRHAIERMAPAAYLGATYFERWLAALETLLVEKDVVTEAELRTARRSMRDAADPTSAIPTRTDSDLTARVRTAFERPADYERPGDDPQFAPGDPVRVRNIHPDGHTRCPRYVRQASGEIERVQGTHVFPDANAHGPEEARPLYTVAFEAEELWGPDAENPADTIHVDLWEPYLQPADGPDPATTHEDRE